MDSANKDTKITVYWLEKSRSQRILWLLEELNLTYDLKIFQRRPDLQAPEELKKIHPLGKSPVVTLEPPPSSSEPSKPLVLAESAAITEYLCEHFGGEKLVPQRYAEGKEGQIGGESEEWMRYRYFMHYTEGSLMALLVIQLIMDRVKDAPVPFFLKFIPRMVAMQVEKAFLTRNIIAQLNFLEERLKTAPSGGPFFCGNSLTAADIMLSFPLIAASSRLDLDKYPLLKGYVDRIQQIDTYKRAVEKVKEVDGKYEPI